VAIVAASFRDHSLASFLDWLASFPGFPYSEVTLIQLCCFHHRGSVLCVTWNSSYSLDIRCKLSPTPGCYHFM